MEINTYKVFTLEHLAVFLIKLIIQLVLLFSLEFTACQYHIFTDRFLLYVHENYEEERGMGKAGGHMETMIKDNWLQNL